jgi:anti-anti-sigma regulatory factor
MKPAQKPAPMTDAEIRAMHDRMTDQVAYMEARTKTCKQCSTALLPGSFFCHRCGRRVTVAGADNASSETMTIKLNGLYDDKRREELALSLIPILADLSQTIDMTNVEHLDVAALFSLIPLLEARETESKDPINVIGMNDSVHNALARAGLAKFFRRI